MTPLHLAAGSNHTKVATTLLYFQADPNLKDNVSSSLLLLHHYTDLTNNIQEGMYPLHVATVHNCIEFVRTLLRARADPNTKDDVSRVDKAVRLVVRLIIVMSDFDVLNNSLECAHCTSLLGIITLTLHRFCFDPTPTPML
jgi:hypothetical protein